jgi:hypothetical protein
MSPPPDDRDTMAERLNKLLHELDRQTAAASDLEKLVNKGLAATHTHHAIDDAARGAPGSDDEPDPDERRGG